MGRQPRRQQGTQFLVQRIEPECSAQGGTSNVRQCGFGRRKRKGRPAGVGLQIRHTYSMSYKFIVRNPRAVTAAGMQGRLGRLASQRPGLFIATVLAAGVALGFGASAGVGLAGANGGYSQASYEAELEQVRRQSQQEINALAARLGELQAQANRLNALGERLTEAGQLEDGEFDFQGTPGQGGAETPSDMPLEDLTAGMDQVQAQFASAGRQLSVMEALLFDQRLESNAVPSRSPVRRAYITSAFGKRADPFGRGGQFHKGIDFNANVGDPVLAVADGVVSFAGTRNGYGHTIEVDHGNGYVTRYAHNSRLSVKEGDLVRAGDQVAKAGSSGRSTGAHVHFEVWENGNVVNPRKFLGDGRAPVARTQRG
jgi:murein DD-endopeptidase MepM/ murein hydrolase activator NlpD